MAFEPLQICAAAGLITATGSGFIVTVAAAVAEQLFASVPVTE